MRMAGCVVASPVVVIMSQCEDGRMCCRLISCGRDHVPVCIIDRRKKVPES